jgi:hypothetical protein
VNYPQSRQDYWRYTPSGANQLAMSAGLEAAAGKSMGKPMKNLGNPWKISRTWVRILNFYGMIGIEMGMKDDRQYKTNHLCSLLIQGGAQIQAG